jgi:predicted amidohydrolase
MAQKHPVIPATLYNSGVLIGPQGVIGVHHKMHLPLIEKLYFYAGNESEVFKTELGNIGVEVCYDARFPEISRLLALKGAEIICCGWAIPATYAKVTPAEDSLYHRAYVRAQENGVFFINANRSGHQGDVRFTGHSAIAAPSGTLIAISETDQEEVIRAVLKEEELINYRSTLNIFRDRRPELYEPICAPLSEPYRSPIVMAPELRKPESKKNER